MPVHGPGYAPDRPRPCPTRSNVLHWPLRPRLARTVNAAREADARRRPNGGTALAGPRRAARGLRTAVDGGDGLHQVVRTHLERFLAETAAATDGVGVPRFTERELRDLLGCGALGWGFARAGTVRPLTSLICHALAERVGTRLRAADVVAAGAPGRRRCSSATSDRWKLCKAAASTRCSARGVESRASSCSKAPRSSRVRSTARSPRRTPSRSARARSSTRRSRGPQSSSMAA